MSVNVLRIAAAATAIGHQDRRQRPEDEEEDHHRAEAADDRLDEDVPAAPAVRARLFERVVARDLDLDPGRQPARRQRRELSAAPLVVENVDGPGG